MAEKHPDELELLSFVEEELGAGARQEVTEHLVACRSCADQVRRLATGRSALRAAPSLELPAGRRETILASLPERRDPWRLFRPVKRAVVIAAPVAAAAALVGVFVLAGTQLDSGGDDDSGDAAQVAGDAGAGETLRESGGADEEATEDAPALAAPAGSTFVRSVHGPPAEVVRALEDEGIAAEIDSRGRVIAEARSGEVTAALAGRPPGNVGVYVR
jgi:anti-sigma factor RsiW